MPGHIARSQLILILTLLSCNISIAQNQTLQFQKVVGPDGRSLGKLGAIAQDLSGFMWFVSQTDNAVYKYDGHRWERFSHDILDSNSLGFDDIETLYADRTGTIWIGGAGLDRLNSSTGSITHYEHSESDPTSLSGFVYSILMDKQGVLWIGTNNGLDYLDERTGTFHHYRNDPKDASSISDNVVRTIYEDKNGSLWIGTGNPFSNLPLEGVFLKSTNWPSLKEVEQSGGLNRMEINGTFTRFMHDDKDDNSLISNKVTALFEDSHRTFWIGTSGDGLHTMDMNTGTIHRHLNDPSQPQKLSRPPLKKDLWQKENDHIHAITEDLTGSIWIGTMCAGINRYDPVSKNLILYDRSFGFPDSTNWNLYTSRDGTLWVSTQEGNLYKVDPRQKEIRSIVCDAPVHGFLEDQNSLWVATFKGLLQLDKSYGLIQKFVHDPADGHSLFSNNLVTIFQDRKDTIWLGAKNGYGILNLKSMEFARYPYEGNSDPQDMGIVSSISGGKMGSTWIALTQEGLINIASNGKFKLFALSESNEDSKRLRRIVDAEEDKHGFVWIATLSNTIGRLDKSTGEVKRYPIGAYQFTLFIDSSDVLWVGTNKGLFYYDALSNEFLRFDHEEPDREERILSIAEDSANHLWIATSTKLSQINPERTKIKVFSTGIAQQKIIPGSIHVRPDGKVLVGYETGFYEFDPSREEPIRNLAIHFTGIFVNNQRIDQDNGQVAVSNVDEITSFSLRYDKNDLAFNFSAMDYLDPAGTEYYCKLDGYEDAWRKTMGGDPGARYFNIPPGDYTFRIRAYSSDGRKAEKVLAVIVSRPWWQTIYAFVVYCIVFIGLLLGGRRLVARQERLMAALQMEQSSREQQQRLLEKANQIDKAKTTFFTNITHEFRTPLTLISGPVQTLLQEFSEQPKIKWQLEIIQRNAGHLLKQINQLLELAKLESGSLVINETENDLTDFLRMTIESYKLPAAQKGIVLEANYSKVVCVACFDRDKLAIIISNLLTNAIKFTPEGGIVKVDLKLEEVGLDTRLVIEVVDTGVGIPQEHHAKLFDRFYRVPENGGYKEPGTGIGLALVKELTEVLAGSIEVESAPGAGSRFKSIIPIQIISIIGNTSPTAGVEATDLSSIQRDEIQQKQMHKLAMPKVMVVEDNAELQNYLISIISSKYNCIAASNGKEAFQMAEAELPDLIVSDVMMPELDGFALTYKLKNTLSTNHIPIILLTAKAEEQSKLEGLELGADDYLCKPFNNTEFALKIQNAIESRSRIREKLRLKVISQPDEIQAQSADERFISKLRDIIQGHLADQTLSPDWLAGELGLSRAQFYRKVSFLCGMPIGELIKEFRLQKAAQLFEQNWGPVAQVAYEVGFSSLSYFGKCFKNRFGSPPSEYKKISVAAP